MNNKAAPHLAQACPQPPQNRHFLLVSRRSPAQEPATGTCTTQVRVRVRARARARARVRVRVRARVYTGT